MKGVTPVRSWGKDGAQCHQAQTMHRAHRSDCVTLSSFLVPKLGPRKVTADSQDFDSQQGISTVISL